MNIFIKFFYVIIKMVRSMNKVFNVLGILLSFILTIVLSIVVTSYALILNVSSFTNESMINKVLVDVDLTETIKLANDGKFWKGLVLISRLEGYSEENLEVLLNSTHLKQFFSKYISGAMEGVLYEKEFEVFSEEELNEVLSKTIDDYNMNSDNEISNKMKANILDFTSDNYEYIKDLIPTSEEINVSLKDNKDFVQVKDTYVFLTSSKTKGILIGSILLLIGLIALLRFSYYKWSFYSGISLLLSSVCLFVSDSILGKIDISSYLEGNSLMTNMVISLIKTISDNLFVTAFILLVIAIFSFVLHYHFKASFHLTEKIKNKVFKKKETLEMNTKEESE